MYKKVKERVSKKWAFVSLSVLFFGLGFTGLFAVLLAPIDFGPDIPSSAHLQTTESVTNSSVAYPVLHVSKVDAILRNYATHRTEDFWRELGGDTFDLRNRLTIKHALLYYGEHFATVAFDEHKQFYGKSPVISRTVMSFDLQAQKLLTLGDLFTDQRAANALLLRIVRDYFTERQSSSDLQQFQLDQVTGFAFGDHAIVLYVKPGKNKAIETISIKSDLLATVLKQDILGDTSRISVVAANPTYQVTTMPPHIVPIDPNKKMLAITFDDGPGVLTPRVLDVLQQYDAHATFFVIGRQVPTYAGTVKREVIDGHEVGNHTWDHPNLTLLDQATAARQVDRTQDAVRQATNGYTPQLLRPPQGAFNGAVASLAQTRGMQLALWNVDTLDWLDRDSELIYRRIMASAGDGRIILVHDIHPTSVEAVIRAIPELITQGYQLVTWSDLNKYR